MADIDSDEFNELLDQFCEAAVALGRQDQHLTGRGYAEDEVTRLRKEILDMIGVEDE
jgi:hypothetical protein